MNEPNAKKMKSSFKLSKTIVERRELPPAQGWVKFYSLNLLSMRLEDEGEGYGIFPTY